MMQAAWMTYPPIMGSKMSQYPPKMGKMGNIPPKRGKNRGDEEFVLFIHI